MEQTFDVTALQYPFPCATNPHAAEVESKIGGWIKAHYDFLPEKVKKKYMHTGVGLAAGCMFPRADIHQLTAICRFYLWAFIVDDSFEYASVEEIHRIQDKSMPVLKGHDVLPDSALNHQLLILRRELMMFASESWMNRFCRNLEFYFEGVVMEIPYRKDLCFPSFETFYDIRERSVNVHPLVNLAEAITGISLPDNIAYHPVMQEIAQLTCRILACCNDLLSAFLEKGHDVLNLVLMLEHNKKCSLKEAYHEALQIHDKDVTRMWELKNNLPDFGIYTETVNAYIENLELMIRGHLYWTQLYTERYKSNNGHPSGELKADQLKVDQLKITV
ncbi:terpene synthase family protein [Chitinophaga flava]|uniref:Terpene synthase n=1 Tax=Chitinophaga flava TaxID=2259036 RepID=A0A365XQ85_9BACT|nr:hypothetical protein [Chitinophaga flava]RBL88497.1 hypothetical protein DF182_18120 [Chitinophaga flava]